MHDNGTVIICKEMRLEKCNGCYFSRMGQKNGRNQTKREERFTRPGWGLIQQFAQPPFIQNTIYAPLLLEQNTGAGEVGKQGGDGLA